MFKRILIANRGEVALRVIRACREMGVESVAVCSEADRGAAYLDLADQSICIGPAKSTQSYLAINRIIAAAEVGDCEAIHPGYGFLAENSRFASICRKCNIEFIGPPHEAMDMLGDKNVARTMARECGVPTVPGSDGLIEDVAEAKRIAKRFGYPVLVKASAGGGGRGMRVARNDEELEAAMQQASSEASAAFGNGDIYLEKYVENPRHVEVQVLADNAGNAVHLWERDCSTQRRHQKLVEESPAPNLPQSVREAICAAAVQMIRAAKYTNAGTVEFIVDHDFNFYFIEVNARIQVEHPVSEMVTGIDLIQWQIRIAAGEKLAFTQQDIPCMGSAIECRINAEDPENGFRPSPGTITRIIPPGGFGVRFDSHVYSGYTVSPHYDSMIGKLIVHRATREEAIATMRRALRELRVEGVKTTATRQLEILEHPDFAAGKIDTGFIERHWPM